jgi:hypothetical protein
MSLSALTDEAVAQDKDQDSIVTPFRKGRWLSGLSGSFNSNTLELSGSDQLVTTNAYNLEIFTGTFFRDRWFIGANVLAGRSSGGGLIDRESETFLIGPSASYYFLKETYGSLYFSLLPGYLRIRESSNLELDGRDIIETVEGPGFALRTKLGYAYVISDRIVLDVGVGTTFAWLDVQFESGLDRADREQSIFSNATFFSFGFNVLLDEFFF